MAEEADDWEQTWDARKTALESVLGPADDGVLHAMLPFHMGGQADVLQFSKHVPGRVACTCELLDAESQKTGELGRYELAIAHRDDQEWGPNLISQLAAYTCDALLEPGHTMGIGSAVPRKSTIVGLMFVELGRMKYNGAEAGILLCLGITADELRACQAGKTLEVLEKLKENGIYPYTDLFRPSVLPPPPGGGLWGRLFGKRN